MTRFKAGSPETHDGNTVYLNDKTYALFHVWCSQEESNKATTLLVEELNNSPRFTVGDHLTIYKDKEPYLQLHRWVEPGSVGDTLCSHDDAVWAVWLLCKRLNKND